LDWRKKSAPLVVFTHGATIDHHEWDATLLLVGEKFRVFPWDLRAHGLSRPGIFAMPAAVDDLIELLNSEKVEQAIWSAIRWLATCTRKWSSIILSA
jgi:3-oxoadipate enol-lactonase